LLKKPSSGSKLLRANCNRAEDVEFLMTQRDTAIKAQFLAIPSRTARLLVGKTDYQRSTIF